MRTSVPERSGSMPFGDHRTFYRIVGDIPDRADGPAATPPLLALHGGPGLPHPYLEPLGDLAQGGRAVVFYDQLGCGRSDRPEDDGLWTFDTFVAELRAIVDHLGLREFHLWGHSWGGWLALETLVRGPLPGLRSLTLASTCASLPAFGRTTRALKETLPAEVQVTLDQHEAAGTLDDPAYQAASFAYIGEFIFRGDEIPPYVQQALEGQNVHISQLMQGPEWNVTGTIRDWDVTDRLGAIEVPTLVTSGRYDEMTDALVRPLVDGIAGARWVRFEDSAHMAFIEERERYMETLGSFLREVDARHG